MSTKTAQTDHPIHQLLAQRWSPCAFAEREVSERDLQGLFEAARWTMSSFNMQPWSYLVARRRDEASFSRMLSCLVEPNQVWAKHAPVLALGVAATHFAHNGEPNKAATHDLGAASAGLTFEASARGLFVHQMIGILPDQARELYEIPDGHEAVTGLAIGTLGDPKRLPEKLRTRDEAERTRKPLAEFVFSGRWGHPSDLV